MSNKSQFKKLKSNKFKKLSKEQLTKVTGGYQHEEDACDHLSHPPSPNCTPKP
ncbi:MAG TPA: hypothetical protein DCS93_30310 [Microscillaceae bacterium]|nr:hypothetical protein [Microscillaceae bacterium]